MSYKKAQNEILDLVTARYPFLYVLSEDDLPVINTFIKLASEFSPEEKYDVFVWNLSSGLVIEHGECGKKGFLTKEPTVDEKVRALFDFIKAHEKNAIFILQDFDYVLKDHKQTVFGLKETIQSISKPIDLEQQLKRHQLAFKGSGDVLKHICITSSNQYIPQEIDKLTNLVDFGMPGDEEIAKVLEQVNETAPHVKLIESTKEEVIRAGIGLTIPEFTNALFKSLLSKETFDPKFVADTKSQIVKKGGLIEFTTPDTGGVENVGGMIHLLNWVDKRKIAFNEEKRVARKLPYPKGVLLTGIQGGGKSLAVKVMAESLGMPLIRLDIGKIKGKYVGESEKNMRKAIALAEAVSPAVLWLDEVEKAFSDPRNANTHDVDKGLLGYFLTWMQEKKKPVFVAATANNIDGLPPELLRKGRFDEIFWVGLPDEKARKQIFEIYLEKIAVNPATVDLESIVQKSEGYSGAEIQAAVQEANFHSAYDDEPVSAKYILEELERTTPISVIRKDDVERMKKWATNNKVRSAN